MSCAVSKGGLTVRIGNAYIKGSGTVEVSRWTRSRKTRSRRVFDPFIFSKPYVRAQVSGSVTATSGKLLRRPRADVAPVTVFFGQGRTLYGYAFVDASIQGRHVDAILVAAGPWKMRPKEGD